MGQYNISQKSEKFIDDLRVYLFSSGKNEAEIKEISEELEVHLYEAEQKGKSVEEVVGSSPKEYMEMISSEMKIDYPGWAKHVPLIILGAISFKIIGDLLQGTLQYSLLHIIATILFPCLFLGGVFGSFRYVSKHQLSNKAQFAILLIPIFFITFSFGGLLLLDTVYSSPMIGFGVWGSAAIGVGTLIFIILFSLWAKTMILPLMMIAFYLPTFALSYTNLGLEFRLIIGMAVTYLVIGLYVFYTFKKIKKERQKQISF
ncbi:HAAS domain-containing protein [Alteribacillus sp. HJP-4]|uniref:HAAS domain-containing protein n=1 Tax=Alteribacillus sp. HJP-4 TaxID=2775394 RepID=UPI0035CCEB2E